MLGQVRVLTPPHLITETRPTFEKFHLHIWENFPQLEVVVLDGVRCVSVVVFMFVCPPQKNQQKLCKSIDFDTCDFETFAKTPFAVILAKKLIQFKEKVRRNDTELHVPISKSTSDPITRSNTMLFHPERRPGTDLARVSGHAERVRCNVFMSVCV